MDIVNKVKITVSTTVTFIACRFEHYVQRKMVLDVLAGRINKEKIRKP
jgi:hypothetical protein